MKNIEVKIISGKTTSVWYNKYVGHIITVKKPINDVRFPHNIYQVVGPKYLFEETAFNVLGIDVKHTEQLRKIKLENIIND